MRHYKFLRTFLLSSLSFLSFNFSFAFADVNFIDNKFTINKEDLKYFESVTLHFPDTQVFNNCYLVLDVNNKSSKGFTAEFYNGDILVAKYTSSGYLYQKLKLDYTFNKVILYAHKDFFTENDTLEFSLYEERSGNKIPILSNSNLIINKPIAPTPLPTPGDGPSFDLDLGQNGNSDINGILDTIVLSVKNFFKNLSRNGLVILTTAVIVATIFVGAKWLWRKTKEFLSSV